MNRFWNPFHRFLLLATSLSGNRFLPSSPICLPVYKCSAVLDLDCCSLFPFVVDKQRSVCHIFLICTFAPIEVHTAEYLHMYMPMFIQFVWSTGE